VARFAPGLARVPQKDRESEAEKDSLIIRLKYSFPQFFLSQVAKDRLFPGNPSTASRIETKFPSLD
jgi:hypothetical protein